jgi:hypothetical protein
MGLTFILLNHRAKDCGGACAGFSFLFPFVLALPEKRVRQGRPCYPTSPHATPFNGSLEGGVGSGSGEARALSDVSF